jgi:predicted ATPase/class 3 adenylate cyclase
LFCARLVADDARVPEQPSGTVTLVFTDIEGSTRLLHELGQNAYREALAEHRRIVRDAFVGGYEVDYEGDAFFYAFRSAGEALAAVSEAMRGLERGPIQIRVGVHTGEPGVDPPKYVGLDVHLAARVMSVGHGGQVLLTRTTRDLLDAEVLDLGEHRLKDIQGPVWLYQLGETPFPPLRTVSNTNLPRPASSFVGRQREVEEVASLLRDGARLVTLAGPGGSGKTRLAIEAASDMVGAYRAGVFWVGLAPLREPSLVLETIRQALGATEPLTAHVGEREMMLLLDNFEQVVAAAQDVSFVLRECPNLRLLITSRELLRIDGEVPVSVLPLVQAEAVQLFCERSRLPADSRISELCGRVDNLPLAVELAAARARVLTVEQIAERLGDRLDLFKAGRDVDPRQQTLRATIDWSYDLLDEPDALLFRRLAVFAGGCTLEAAESVCDAHLDDLQSLVDKNLVRCASGRFWMLETIREYGEERLLGSGEADALHRRHARHMLSLAEAVAPYRTPAASRAPLDRLEQEVDNFRAALAWTLVADPGSALLLAGALGRFWYARGYLDEARRWLAEVLAGEQPPSEALWRALNAAGNFAQFQADHEAAKALFERALKTAGALEDETKIALTLGSLGNVASDLGDLAAAERYLEEVVALSRAASDKSNPQLESPLEAEMVALCNLGLLRWEQGDLDAAAALTNEGLALGRSLDHKPLVAQALGYLGLIRHEQGAGGDDLVIEQIAIARQLGDHSEILWAVGCAAVLLSEHRPADAAQLIGAFEAGYRQFGYSLSPTDRHRVERAHAISSTALGEERLAELLTQGGELTPEAAGARALELLQEQGW